MASCGASRRLRLGHRLAPLKRGDQHIRAGPRPCLWANARRFLKHYLEAGLDINAADQRSALRWTALHSMVLGPDVTAIRVLLDHGASPSIPDAEGRTALDIARHQHAKRPTPESAEVVRLLEQAGQRASGS